MMSNDKKLNFAEIDKEELLINYLKDKALRHRFYKIYTKYDRAENILSTRAVYLSKGIRWNDIIDRNILNNENYDKINFALCFSCRQSEDVSMWMLYAGKENGCMLNLKISAIKSLLKTEKIVLGHFENGSFIETKTLYKKDFNIELQDVVYYKESNEALFDIRHPGDNDNHCFSNIDFLKYFKKRRPWSYENECRLVVSFDKTLLTDDVDTVCIKFDEKLNNNEITLYDSPLANGVRKNYKASSLSGKIDWDLCIDCDEKKKCETCNIKREIA